MILKIQQTKKELFSAAFDILHKEERVGTISVSGKLGSMEADIRVNVFGNIFTMKYAGGLFAEQKIKKGYGIHAISFLPFRKSHKNKPRNPLSHQLSGWDRSLACDNNRPRRP